MSCFFKGKSPCKDCPYRVDAPLQKWDKQHFKDLLDNDRSMMGSLYLCHKNNGTACKGWLMDQDKRRFPSLHLRMKASRDNLTAGYLDSLSCKSDLYNSVEEMIEANYPELLQ